MKSEKVEKILEIKKIKLSESRFDLQVEGNHNYFANGILVHNCRLIFSKKGAFSRKGKPIVSVPHIEEFLKTVFNQFPDLVFDGEIYSHQLKDDFDTLMSLARQSKPTKEDIEASRRNLQYWVYDFDGTMKKFMERFSWAERKEVARYFNWGSLKDNEKCPVVFVNTEPCLDQTDLDRCFEEYLKEGFEGQMIRDSSALYINGRTDKLLKRKKFMDEEFEVVEIKEGTGNRAGMAATVVCKVKDGRTFGTAPLGSWDFCRRLLNEKDSVVGKMATVVFQNYTPDGIPRFGKTKAIRDYE